VTGGAGPIKLSLTPAGSSVAANTTINLTLSIDTGTEKATAAAVELAYLPGKCVTPITVTKGDFLTVVLSAPKVTGNKISFTYAVPPQSGGKQGTGTLATITTGPTMASCVLSITKNTLAAAIGFPGNALASASDAVINLTGASASHQSYPTHPTPTPNSIFKILRKSPRKIVRKYGERHNYFM
jgi:hypothetical protein